MRRQCVVEVNLIHTEIKYIIAHIVEDNKKRIILNIRGVYILGVLYRTMCMVCSFFYEYFYNTRSWSWIYFYIHLHICVSWGIKMIVLSFSLSTYLQLLIDFITIIYVLLSMMANIFLFYINVTCSFIRL